MTTLITDPLAAYSDATTDGAPAATVQEFRCVTTVAKGEALKLSVSSGVFTVAQSTAATDAVIGVAAESVVGTSARPVSLKVVTGGPALAQTADADIDSGDWVQPTTSGTYTTATTSSIANANGSTLGRTLEATVASTATAGDLKWIWVQPSLIAVT